MALEARVIRGLALTFLLMGGAVAKNPSPLPAAPDVEVTFESSAGRCGGLLAARWIITARHCVDDLVDVIKAGGKITVRHHGQIVIYTDKELLQTLASATPNSSGEALSLDFALLPAPGALIDKVSPPDPVAADQLKGLGVGYFDFDGAFKTCQVKAVCGAQLDISCAGDSLPAKGISGHVLYTSEAMRPVGILTDNFGSSETALAASYATIMGRSSALAEAWNSQRKPPAHVCDNSRPDGRYCALSAEFARSKRYRYPLEDGSDCRRAVLRPRIHSQRIQSNRFFTSAAIADQNTALLADISTKSICLFDRMRNATGKCFPLPATFGPSIRGILNVGANKFIISQDQIRSPDIGENQSTITIADYDPIVKNLSFGAPIIAPLRQVIAATVNGDGSIILGGTGGVCLVAGSACTKIIWHAANPAQSDWIVRGFLTLPTGNILAVGRDLRNDGVGGTARRHIPFARCWTMGATLNGFNYLSPCGFSSNSFVERLAQLNSPMTVSGEPIAFSSSGEAVSLMSGRIGRVIAFDNLMSSSRPSSALDDVVRAARQNKDDTITVASSDGSVRIIKVEPDSKGKPLRLVADDAYTAFDLALWIVDVASGDNWAVAVAQSGEAVSLNWSPLPKNP